MRRYIKLSSVDIADSWRMDVELSDTVESIRRNGFPFWKPRIILRTTGERFTVLAGNRLVGALQWLAENDPVTFAKTLPDAMIPAIIITIP